MARRIFCMTLGIDIGCGALLQVVLDDWIRGACFHGDTVAVGTYSGTVLVSDMRTGELLHVFTGHDGVSMNSRMLSNGAILSEVCCEIKSKAPQPPYSLYQERE